MQIALIVLSAAALGLTILAVLIWRSREKLLEDLQIYREKLAQAEAQSQAGDSFKGLAASALESSMTQFLNMAQNTFQQAREVQALDATAKQKAIDDLVKPMNEALKRYQDQIEGLEKERLRAFSSIDRELKVVSEGQNLLASETAALKNALKRPHVRGRWGEVQLRNCVELAGMSEFADVSFQASTTDEDGARHIPDMIVRMPGGRQVIVDAKTPLDAFISSLEAATDEQRAIEMARHARHVKEHVKRLSTRAYADQFKESADFTVLFLPNESFLYAALEVENDIIEYALEKKVLIATPPTLVGLLKVIRYGWNEQKLAENAQKISEMGQDLHKRLCDFVESYVNVGKHLDKARDEFEKGRTRLESRVLVQARRFESLGAKSNKSLIEAPAGEADT